MSCHRDSLGRSENVRRLVFAVFGGLLLIGCALVPVDTARFQLATSLRFRPSHAPYARSEIIFSHEVHGFEVCETCHFESDESVIRESPELPAMAVCLDCHDNTVASRDCITCHVENRQYRKPHFHDATWPRHHENMAREEAYKCELCHVEKECKGCHMARRPLSHTPRFNRSTHGRVATHDRRSCATCHESSFCENCHSQPPPDHTPAFIGDPVTGRAGHKHAAILRPRSCLVCHGFDDVCARCHVRP